MTEFGAAGTLDVHVSQSSLRDARAEIEDELGDVTVDVAAESGPTTSAVTDGGSALADSGMLDELDEQTDLLEDILDELEQGGVGGGGGGLGGGGGMGLGLVGGGAAGATMSGATLAGGALTGTLAGLVGSGLLEATGFLDATEDVGSTTRQTVPGADVIGDAATMIPGAAIASTFGEVGTLDFKGAIKQYQRFQESRQQVLEDNTGEQVADRAQISQGLLQLASGSPTKALTTFSSAVIDSEDFDTKTDDLPAKLDRDAGEKYTTQPDASGTRQLTRRGIGELSVSDRQLLLQADRQGSYQLSNLQRKGDSLTASSRERLRAITQGGDQSSTTSQTETQSSQSNENMTQRFNIPIDVQVDANPDISNFRDLQELVQNPSRWIDRNLDLPSGVGF